MHHTLYGSLLYCTICVKEHFTVNQGSLSSLSTSGDHFNEAAIPAVNLWHFDLLLHPGSLLQAAHPCSQEPSHTGALGILQAAGPSGLPVRQSTGTHGPGDYLETDSRRFSCSTEGQAIIWISSGLNSSFSRAWNFWKTC